jgi:hypothetical protein
VEQGEREVSFLVVVSIGSTCGPCSPHTRTCMLL